MERLKRHTLYLIVLLAVAGVAMAITPPRALQVNRQDEIEKRVPHAFGPYVLQDSPDMGEATWEALNPDAMVWHIYSGPESAWIDFVLVAGRSADAFHDPQLCFRNQGWRMKAPEKWRMRIDALDREVDVNLLSMTGASGTDATAVYFFISPLGYTASALKVKLSLFAAKTFGMSMGQGYFLRFIVPASGDRETDLRRLEEFVSAMMEELGKSLPDVIGV